MKESISKQVNWIDEYHQGMRFGLAGKILCEVKSKYQRITIIESLRYGKGLLLDGCWMTTEHQESSYHECLVHPALSSAEQIKNILIIGGGDGGAARECLKYQEVEKIDLIEIDEKVIELSKKYLPSIGGQAWSDHRLNIKIKNGIEWVKNTQEQYYDVIIIDGSDPNGPAKGLFNKKFFINCRRILKSKGIFATQSESPEAFKDAHVQMIKIIREVFHFADPLYGWVPIYPSGWWSWTFAANEKPYYFYPNSKRSEMITQKCQIWNQGLQKNGFEAMPNFIKRELTQ